VERTVNNVQTSLGGPMTVFEQKNNDNLTVKISHLNYQGQFASDLLVPVSEITFPACKSLDKLAPTEKRP